MFPLFDEEGIGSTKPFVTVSLIIVNTFLSIIFLLSPNFESLIYTWGIIPATIFEGENLHTFITSIFLHGDYLHLASNMWYLWLFGDNLEANIGHLKFLIFYLIAGLLAGIVHLFTASDLSIPAIGASGAIAGLMGGYFILHPNNKIKCFSFVFFRPAFYNVPAWFFIGLWFLLQLLYFGFPTDVAFGAHIGGFIAGLIMIFFLKQTVLKAHSAENLEYQLENLKKDNGSFK